MSQEMNNNTSKTSSLKLVELSIIATLIQNPNFYEKIRFLSEEDFLFYKPTFSYVKENLGKSPKELVLLLGSNNLLTTEEISLVQNLAEPDDSDYLVNIAKEIKESIVLVKMRHQIKLLNEKSFNSIFELKETLENFIKQIDISFDAYSGYLTMGEVFNHTYKAITTEKKTNYNFHIGYVDNLFTDFVDGNTIVIGARPGVGKTAFGLWAGLNLAAKNIPVHFISMEMNVWQLGLRLITAASGIPQRRLIDSMNSDDLKIINDIGSAINNLPIFVTSEYYPTIDKIEHTIRQSVIRNKTKVFFLDYIQLITNPGLLNRHLEVASVAQKLKNLAIELDIAIVEMSQLARKPNKEPVMMDLKESGDIEQAASMIILLWNEDEKKDDLDENSNDNDNTNNITNQIDEFIESGLPLDSFRPKLNVNKYTNGIKTINYKIEKHRNGALFYGKMFFDANNMAFFESRLFRGIDDRQLAIEKLISTSAIRKYMRDSVLGKNQFIGDNK